MKKITVLVAFIIALIICGATVFAVEFVDLVPLGPNGEPLKTFPTKELYGEVCFTASAGEQFYINLDPESDFKDIRIASNGIASAKLVDYDPETMVDYMGDDKENKFVTYKVYDNINETDVATGLSYFEAKEIAKETENYSIVAESYVNIIEFNIAENFSDTYNEGMVIIEATLDGKEHQAEAKFVSDVFIKDFSEPENISEEAKTLNSSPETSVVVKHIYKEKAFERNLEEVIGAVDYDVSEDLPEGISISGKYKYSYNIGNNVFTTILSGTPVSAGTSSFSVTYYGENRTEIKKINYTLVVEEKAPYVYISSINIEKWPEKTEYYLGDSVDLTGMKVTAIAYNYNEELAVYEPSEIDVTDLCYAEPKIFTSDEAQNVEVYLKAPCNQRGDLKLFNDHFRVTFKYKDEEPEDVPATNEYIELNVGEDPGYSSYESEMYGYAESSLETPAHIISTEGFMSALGGKAVINGDCFTLTIPKISSAQRGVNFLYDHSFNLDENNPYEGYPSIKFYSDAVIWSDYIFEWNLGIGAYDLRELLGSKAEEDIIDYYVIDENDKCVGKFTVDYATADLTEDVVMKIPVQSGSKLPNYRIDVEVPAGNYDIPDVDGNLVATGFCGAEGDGKNLQWTINSSYILTISGTGKMADYTNMDRPWKKYDNEIKFINIENGVETIGNYAFYNFKNMVSVLIPDSVYEIRSSAFSQCDSLKNVVIPEGIMSVQVMTFSDCDNLETVVLPKTVTKIEANAFGNCPKLKNINLPTRLLDIGINAFSKCTSLETIIIPDRVTGIGASAFSGCSNLSKVVIPKSVSSIGTSTFKGCNLKTAGLAGGGYDIEFSWSENIPTTAFYWCDSLESVVLPDSIKNIYPSVFAHCENLKEVALGSNVGYIGPSCFWECNSLESISIPESVTSIGSGAFMDCKNLKTVEFEGNNLTYIGSSAFSGCIKLKNIVLPDSITWIDTEAFYNCIALEGINMPKNLRNVGKKTFYNCYNLSDVTFFVGIESIGAGAFDFCDAMKNVYFYGDAPEVNAAGSENQSFDPNIVTVQYIAGKEGWETDSEGKWNGYNTAVWGTSFLLGDVNLDNEINVKDVYFVRMASAKLITISETQKLSADVNGDGKINAIDANLIRKFCANIIDKFPVEN